MGNIKDLALDEVNEIRKEVEQLIEEVERTHRYSMSQIYGLYNKVYNTNETPQSCASCLIRKVNQLKTWLSAQPVVVEKEIKTKKKKK